MCLAHSVNSISELDYAYIVLGGTGWTKDSFFLNELKDWVNNDAKIRVVRLEEFVGLANNSSL